MKKPLRIYKIHPGYKSCTVWEGSRMTHSRIAEHNTKPLSKDHAERHRHIAAWLWSNFEIPGPVYDPTR